MDHLLKHDTRTSQKPLNKLCDALLLLFERRKYERRKKSRASKDVHVEDRRQLYGQSRSMLFFMCIAKGIDVLASSSSAHSGKKEKKYLVHHRDLPQQHRVSLIYNECDLVNLRPFFPMCSQLVEADCHYAAHVARFFLTFA